MMRRMLGGVDLSLSLSFSPSFWLRPSFCSCHVLLFLWSRIYLSSLGILFFISFGLSVWVCICGLYL